MFIFLRAFLSHHPPYGSVVGGSDEYKLQLRVVCPVHLHPLLMLHSVILLKVQQSKLFVKDAVGKTTSKASCHPPVAFA